MAPKAPFVKRCKWSAVWVAGRVAGGGGGLVLRCERLGMTIVLFFQRLTWVFYAEACGLRNRRSEREFYNRMRFHNLFVDKINVYCLSINYFRIEKLCCFLLIKRICGTSLLSGNFCFTLCSQNTQCPIANSYKIYIYKCSRYSSSNQTTKPNPLSALHLQAIRVC